MKLDVRQALLFQRLLEAFDSQDEVLQLGFRVIDKQARRSINANCLLAGNRPH